MIARLNCPGDQVRVVVVPDWKRVALAGMAACLLGVWGSFARVGADDREGAGEIQFNRDIRPILADNCFTCHGPDQAQRQADLRLDLREAATRMGDSGAAIVPGETAKSLVHQRVTTADPDLRMPPPETGKRLTADQIALLGRWIEGGAAWQEHWSQIPPGRSPLPEPRQPGENPIDTLIRARLAKQGLSPSPRADARTLIRRLSFDLTGLPPEPQESEAFAADPSPEAYRALVQRLLASPHYGERMAMYWLDLVRYADTNGFHGDNHRDHALYRDYVIDAFNENLPFDQFTLEQLAGDLLESPTRRQRIASGYNRLNKTTREGGSQPKEYLAKYAADRVRNASTVWLGATMGCAECHDHKFDPYTMKDFYSFAAFFADLKEVAVGAQQPSQLPTPQQQDRLEQLDRQIAEQRAALMADTPELTAAREAWERRLRQAAENWRPAAIARASAEPAQTKLEVRQDGTLLATGPQLDHEKYVLQLGDEAAAGEQAITALRLEALADPQLPQRGPGRAGNGNFVLSELTLRLVPRDGSPDGDAPDGDAPDAAAAKAGGQPRTLSWKSAQAGHSQANWPVAAAIDGKPETGWAILPQAGQTHVAVFQLAEPLRWPADQVVELVLEFHHAGAHSLGAFRVSVTSAASPELSLVSVDPKLQEAVSAPADKRTAAQQTLLDTQFRETAEELRGPRRALAAAEKERAQVVAAAPKILIAETMAPRDMRVLPRGNWMDDSGPMVLPAVPEFLGSLSLGDRRGTRLDLARWLVEPEHPLVARVFVNRVWKLLFGQGIVKTLDDFGSQGAWPTHPELLDYLALEFIESGWDVKQLVQQIVLSESYQQSSLVTSELRERDPYNRLLARQGRFRLDAEMIRDNALAVSGLLVDRQGGVSVKPYQPVGYWAHLNFPKRVYRADEGANQYRRGVYTYWCRTFLHPSMLAFDAPSREECVVERPRSNTPLAALALLNDPTYVEAARAFAQQILNEGGGSVPARIQFAMQQATGRLATPRELEILTELLASHQQQYQEDGAAAEALQQVGLHKPADTLDPPQLAAWTSLARVLLNLHETITRN